MSSLLGVQMGLTEGGRRLAHDALPLLYQVVTIHRDLEMASDETGERLLNEIYSAFSTLSPQNKTLMSSGVSVCSRTISPSNLNLEHSRRP
jgi:hypothetical protein